ncbi:MAG: PRK06851 family protein [Peptococcaceae bacterium]
MSGKLREFFPGGNTSCGFHSFYDFIIDKDATRIFCIKGGPGVGKSTFMKAIGQEMLSRGFEVEYHNCSSDNNSLDGLVIPALRIALIDGTAPHIVDPKNPGVVDEIIHLGDFWDEKGLKENKAEVLESNARVGRLFKIAYSSLKEAKVIHDEWESYIVESMDFAPVNKITRYVAQEVFTDVEPDFSKVARSRHLFGSAITPQGAVNKLASILIDVDSVYVLRGEPGTGKATFIKKMLDKAQEIGIDTEVYHCPLDPEKIDFLVIPKRKVAFINGTEPLQTDLNKFNTTEIDFDQFLDPDILDQYEKEIDSCKERFWDAYNRAIFYIGEAKRVHDELEEYYIPNMDFSAINGKRDEILQKILTYAQELLE